MTVKEFFEERGSKALLAKKMKTSRQVVSLWVTGRNRPNVSSVMKMSDALRELGVNTSPSDILLYINEVSEEYRAKTEEA